MSKRFAGIVLMISWLVLIAAVAAGGKVGRVD
jgi:hypothetical protein